MFNETNRRTNVFVIKTSSEIINEAKASLSLNAAMNTKIVKTSRPFTPKDAERVLFGQKRSERPSSSISLQNIKFQDIDITSKLLKHKSKCNQNNATRASSMTKLPSLANHKSMTSLEKLPEEIYDVVPEQREIHSSPALGVQDVHQESGRVWFPQLLNGNNIKNIIKVGNLKKTKVGWFDTDNTIQENKINEARTISMAPSDTVQSTIASIKKLSAAGYKDEEMIALLKRLFECMEKEQLLKNNGQNLTKNLVLKTVFELIDSKNEVLLMHIANIVLMLRVTGPNLAAICKLVFTISRSDKNDDLFLQKNIIGPFVNCLGLATPEEDAEALVYGYGALKFVTMNSRILQFALGNGILQLMALHLKIINLAKTEGSYFPEPTSHVLFQLTGCLRNVANDQETHSEFLTSGILNALCKTTKLFISDIDLVVNVARIISILSTNSKCCMVMVNDDDFCNTLMNLCREYPNREDVVVRIMYAVGNMLTSYEKACTVFYEKTNNVLDVIQNLMQVYLETDLKYSLENSFNRSQTLVIEDVLIKIIRVIANLCIDENIGMNLLSSKTSFKAMCQFLDSLLIILRRKTIHENEELILSTLSTINNLSYYCHPDLKGPFHGRYLDICEALNALFSTRHVDCIIEVARVYGNLSRFPLVRKYLLETGGLNYVVDWLDNPDEELLRVTSGVLINMMVDREARKFFKNTKGIEKLVQNLVSHAEEDWHLANLICQVIWNFNIEEDLLIILEKTEVQNLINVLVDLLDEERIFQKMSDKQSFEYRVWEEFSVVATNILEKIEAVHVAE